MNKLIKIVSCIMIAAFALTTSTFGNGTNAMDTVDTVYAPITTTTSLFNGGELGVSLGSTYSLGQANQVNQKTLFTQPYSFNVNAGAFWFPWRNLGFEATVPFYQTAGVSVDEVQAGVVLRLPLASQNSFFKHFAPYVAVDEVYNWQNVNRNSYLAKAGLEVRLNKYFGVFAEGQYRNSSFSNLGQGQTSVGSGFRLAF